MTEKYAMKVGAAYMGPSTSVKGFHREIIEGVTRSEKDVSDLRRREEELIIQTMRQEEWLVDVRNRDHPGWVERRTIWKERQEELREVGARANRLLDSLEVEIGMLDGEEREEAWKRFMSWVEPPF